MKSIYNKFIKGIKSTSFLFILFIIFSFSLITNNICIEIQSPSQETVVLEYLDNNETMISNTLILQDDVAKQILPVQNAYSFFLKTTGEEELVIMSIKVKIFEITVKELVQVDVETTAGSVILNDIAISSHNSTGRMSQVDFSEINILPQFVSIFAFISTMMSVLLYLCKKIVSKFTISENYILIALVLIGLVCTFYPLFKGMEISPFNILYYCKPWSFTQANTQGPMLSDVADAILPGVYDIKMNGVHFWNNLNIFGVGMNPFVYLFSYTHLITMLTTTFGTTFATITKYSVAFLGMFLLLKNLKLGKFVCFIGAISFTFSAVMVMWGQWDHTTVISLAPWLILFFLKFVEKLKSRYLFYCIAILFFMFAANMIAYVGYSLYLLGLIMLFQVFVHRADKVLCLKILFGFFAFVIIGVALSAIFYGNLFDSVISTNYIQERSDKILYNLPFKDLLQFINPYLQTEGHINECELFIGILPIVCLPLPLIYKFESNHMKNICFWLTLSFLFSIMIFTGYLDWLFKLLPVINTSYKTRLIVLLDFSLIMSAAYILDSVIKSFFQEKKHSQLIIQVYFISLLIAYVLLKSEMQQSMFANANFNNFKISFIFLVLIEIALYSSLYRRKTINTKAIMALICTLNMGYFASQYIPYVDRESMDVPASDVLKSIKIDSNSRVASIGTWNLPGNMNLLYGINTIRGHDIGARNLLYQSFMKELDNGSFITPTFVSLSSHLNRTLLKYTSVKTLVHENVLDSMSGNLLRDENQEFTVVLNEVGDKESVLLNLDRNAQGSTLLIMDGSHLIWEHTIEEADYVLDDVVYIECPISFDPSLFYKLKLSRGNGLQIQGDQIAYQFVERQGYFINNQFIEEIEADDRFYLTNEVKVYEDEDSVLKAMKTEYYSESLLISENTAKTNDVRRYDDLNKNESYIKHISDKKDHIEITIENTNPCYLVITDTFDNGWEAIINGEPAEIFRTNYLYRGIFIESSGTNEIVLKYKSKSMQISFAISIVSMLSVLLLIANRKKIDNLLMK